MPFGRRGEAVRIRVDLKNETAAWGEAIEGGVVVGTGTTPVQVRSIRVVLPEIRTFPVGKDTSEPVSRELIEVMRLRPGQARYVPLGLNLPWQVIREKRTRLVVTVAWNEESPRDALRAVTHEKTVRRAVNVEPPRALLRLVQGLAEASETEFFAWRDFEGGVAAVLYPRDRVTRHFDALTLRLHREGNTFRGTLVLNLPERTAADHLRAAVGLDRRRLPITIAACSAGRARAYFREQLRQYVDPSWGLPLPASAPQPDPSTLPVPSGSEPTDAPGR